MPYIEVIVISQNEPDDQYLTIKKINDFPDDTIDFTEYAMKYYESEVQNKLDISIKRIIEYRLILDKLIAEQSNHTGVLIDKIHNSINGVSTYESLNQSNLNQVIELFHEFERRIAKNG